MDWSSIYAKNFKTIALATTLGMPNLAQTLTNCHPTDLEIENQFKVIGSVGLFLYDLLDKYYTL